MLKLRVLAIALGSVAMLAAACGGGGTSDLANGSGDDDRAEDSGDKEPTKAPGKKTSEPAKDSTKAADDDGDAPSSDHPDGLKGPNPCSLLTMAEAREILGGEVEEGEFSSAQSSNPFGQSFCTWNRKGEIKFIQVSLVYEDNFTKELKNQKYTAKRQFEFEKALFKDDPKFRELKGVGDGAYVHEGGGGVYKGKSDVLILAIGSDDVIATSEQVARKIAPRLK